jgi:hypothetical protein
MAAVLGRCSTGHAMVTVIMIEIEIEILAPNSRGLAGSLIQVCWALFAKAPTVAGMQGEG